MNEKEIVKGKFSKTNILTIVSISLALVTFIYSFYWGCISQGHALGEAIDYGYFSPFIYVGIPLIILAFVFYFWMSNCELIVTDKRVYGKAAFRKRVDLPFDMISSVGSGIFKSVTVASSSGSIRFYFVDNKEEIFKAITNNLIERQDNKLHISEESQVFTQSNADELKKYHDLLTQGIITQEEFEAKKKLLLNL